MIVQAYGPAELTSGQVRNRRLGGAGSSVDQAARERLAADRKRFQIATQATRLWLLRAVAYLAAEERVTQFVELGAGYPRAPSVHEVAREHCHASRTLYLVRDPTIAAHGQALVSDAQTFFARADLNDSDAIIGEIARVMDLDVPVAVCLSFVAEFIADPAEMIDTVTAALAENSFVALSHITSDIAPAVVETAVAIYASYDIDFRARSRAEVDTLLARCNLVEPGLVAPHRWRPAGEFDRRRARRKGWGPPQEAQVCSLAAVGRLD